LSAPQGSTQEAIAETHWKIRLEGIHRLRLVQARVRSGFAANEPTAATTPDREDEFIPVQGHSDVAIALPD
jgi:hypothetical protein